MARYILGLASVEFGTPTGTVAMPGTMTAFAQTVEGSFTLSESEPQTQEFKVEESDAPVVVNVSESKKLEANWRCYDVDPAIMTLVMGGTSTPGTGRTTWSAPAKSSIIELALRLTDDAGNIVNVPKANVVARVDGQFGRGGILQLAVKATALDPGDGGSPYNFDTEDPV